MATEVACTHKWEPMVIMGRPAKSCPVCREWRQIGRREFRRRFGGATLQRAMKIVGRIRAGHLEETAEGTAVIAEPKGA